MRLGPFSIRGENLIVRSIRLWTPRAFAKGGAEAVVVAGGVQREGQLSWLASWAQIESGLEAHTSTLLTGQNDLNYQLLPGDILVADWVGSNVPGMIIEFQLGRAGEVSPAPVEASGLGIAGRDITRPLFTAHSQADEGLRNLTRQLNESGVPDMSIPIYLGIGGVGGGEEEDVYWEVEPVHKDLIPLGDDQWVGNLTNPVTGVSVGRLGTEEDPHVEGVVMERENTDEGGVLLAGYRGDAKARSPGTEANAPVEIAGAAIVLMSGSIGLEVDADVTEDRFLLIGKSSPLPDGRKVAPILIGPEYVPSNSDESTDARDIFLEDSTEEQVVTIASLNDDYPTGSTFFYAIRLSEERGRTAYFDIRFYVNSVEEYVVRQTLNGNAQYYQESLVTEADLSAGDTIEMRVEAEWTNPNTTPWVRGSLQQSVLRVSK